MELARLAPTSIRQLSVGNPVLISGGEKAYDLEGLADATRQIESLAFFVYPLSQSVASSSNGAKRGACAFVPI